MLFQPKKQAYTQTCPHTDNAANPSYRAFRAAAFVCKKGWDVRGAIHPRCLGHAPEPLIWGKGPGDFSLSYGSEYHPVCTRP